VPRFFSCLRRTVHAGSYEETVHRVLLGPFSFSGLKDLLSAPCLPFILLMLITLVRFPRQKTGLPPLRTILGFWPAFYLILGMAYLVDFEGLFLELSHLGLLPTLFKVGFFFLTALLDPRLRVRSERLEEGSFFL